MKLTDIPSLAEKISQNRNAYFEKININPKKVVSAEIVHGNNVSAVDADHSGKIITSADGLVTQNKNIYLSITSADCLPIFLYEPEKEITGIIHAGWRSLDGNILTNALEHIIGFGGVPKNILTGIGPAICQNHYEVGPEAAEKFTKYQEAVKREGDKIFLDLKKIAILQLTKAGIAENNIEISPECTFELPEKYFSARRDKPDEVETMIAVIGIR